MSSSSFPTIHPPSATRMSQVLSRSSSAASVSSIDTVDDDANFASLSAVPYHISSIDRDDPPRRTRKRFSSTQLMILEHLYHQTSHPTREQREVLAREASIELRSVTVWFQNKRQTERKVALSGGAATPISSSQIPTVDAQEFPANHANHGEPRSRRAANTSQTRPSRSPADPASPTFSTSDSSTRTVRTHLQPRSRSKALLSAFEHRRPSLDHIATRAERSHPRTPTRASCSLPAINTGGSDAINDITTLWANMPSSPLSPASPPSSRDRDRELLNFSKALGGRRQPTLEYACAAARVSRRNVEDDYHDSMGANTAMEVDDEGDVDRMLVSDTGGDTEDEGEHEAITPHSSQGSIGRRKDASLHGTRAWGEQKMPPADEVVLQEHDPEVLSAAMVLVGLARF